MADIGLIHSELDRAWANWGSATLVAKWRQQNPGEAAKLDAYRAGGAVPVLATAMGQALVHETTAWFESAADDPGDTSPPSAPPNLRVASVSATSVVVAWDAAVDETGVVNYRIYRDGVLVGQGPGSSGGLLNQWTDNDLVSGTAYQYAVEAQDAAGNTGPQSTVTATTSGGTVPGDETAWGYIPPVPAGWTLIENTTISVPANASKLYFRNCTGSAWLNQNQRDIIFVDCDMTGGYGTNGENIKAYNCEFGDRVDGDAAQIKPPTSGGLRPKGWLFQGCYFHDITRAPGSTKHTDAIQFGGVLDCTVRHCYFENIAVEMILCNGWNGKPENVLVEASYFGSRTSPGGPPVHFSQPGSAGATHVWASTNCRAVDNYYDGTVASIELGTVGCSQTGTKPRSAWPHGHPTPANPRGMGY